MILGEKICRGNWTDPLTNPPCITPKTPNYCASTKCLNGATKVPDPSTKTCSCACARGYTGRHFTINCASLDLTNVPLEAWHCNVV